MHQCGIPQKLFKRIDPQLAVDIFIVGIDRTFLDLQFFRDFLDTQTVQIIIEDTPLGTREQFDTFKELGVGIRVKRPCSTPS